MFDHSGALHSDPVKQLDEEEEMVPDEPTVDVDSSSSDFEDMMNEPHSTPCEERVVKCINRSAPKSCIF